MKTLNTLSKFEQLNFLLTNRIPRRWTTQLMGWYSKLESPMLTRFSIAFWKLFSPDLDFSESKKNNFSSIHDCFIRELKPNARPIQENPNIIVSPCDAIVGACGTIEGTKIFQAKGFPYELKDLIPQKQLQETYRDGLYVTLRLKSSFYHRFHAPTNCRIRKITYISGDTWNVNPIALKKVEKLFCKNERAVMEIELSNFPGNITLVPVAAILVASMRFHCLGHHQCRTEGIKEFIPTCNDYKKGDELGYFEHGSTIILLATNNFSLIPSIKPEARINMGQALLEESKTSANE